MTVREEIHALYNQVHVKPGQKFEDFEYAATEAGHREMLWDAIILLACRMDGDMTTNPRATREIKPYELIYREEGSV